MDYGLKYLTYHSSDMQGGDGLYSRMSMSGQQLFHDIIDPDLDHKTRRVADKFSENIHAIANEPSLAFFRIQEHVRKTLPQLVEQKHEVQEIQQKVQGACFDTEYATNAVKNMHQSAIHFQNIQDLLKNAMFMKQQIGYEELRRKQEMMKPSMYPNSPSRDALYKFASSHPVTTSSASQTTATATATAATANENNSTADCTAATGKTDTAVTTTAQAASTVTAKVGGKSVDNGKTTGKSASTVTAAIGKAASAFTEKGGTATTKKCAAKDAGKAAGKDAGKPTAKDTGKAVTKDTGKSVAKVTGKAAAKDTGKTATEDTGKSAAKDLEKAGSTTGKTVAKDTGTVVTKDIGKAGTTTGKVVTKDTGKAVTKDSGKAATTTQKAADSRKTATTPAATDKSTINKTPTATTSTAKSGPSSKAATGPTSVTDCLTPSAGLPSLSSSAPSIQDDSGIPRPVSGSEGTSGSGDVVPPVDEASELTEETLTTAVHDAS